MILNDNSTQQINTLVIQLQNRITNLINETNKKVIEINDKISDLDTLKKEIADLTKNNENDSSAMNTQITENKNNIATNASAISALDTQIQTNKDNIATNTSDISALKTSVAVKADIVDTAIETDSTWSSKKISADLADKQDFRIFNSLEEFNEKKGTSFTVVSGIDNMKDIANAMSNGEILIITVRYESGSEVYFGLTTSIGWAKMFTFIKSNGLCDVECRTTFPLTLKRVLNSDGIIGDWQQLATMDNVTQPIGFKTSLLNQCWGYYTKSGKTISVHMKFVLSNALSDWQIISNTKLPTPSSALTKSANGKTGATNSVYIYTDGAMSQAGGGGMPAGTYEFDFDYTMA